MFRGGQGGQGGGRTPCPTLRQTAWRGLGGLDTPVGCPPTPDGPPHPAQGWPNPYQIPIKNP